MCLRQVYRPTGGGSGVRASRRLWRSPDSRACVATSPAPRSPPSRKTAIGFIAVFGVAMLNGIVMVSFLNDLRRQGLPIREAVRHGAALRLRPVLMTASVAILGLIPMLISTGVGAETQRPLATVVVGGLFTSTALTLLLLPLIYEWSETRAAARQAAKEPAASHVANEIGVHHSEPPEEST